MIAIAPTSLTAWGGATVPNKAHYDGTRDVCVCGAVGGGGQREIIFYYILLATELYWGTSMNAAVKHEMCMGLTGVQRLKSAWPDNLTHELLQCGI